MLVTEDRDRQAIVAQLKDPCDFLCLAHLPVPHSFFLSNQDERYPK